MIRALILVLALAPAMAQAQDAHLFRSKRTSCSVRPVDRFYCPWFGSGNYRGPYFDNGCSVTCHSGQQAVCEPATCEEGQTGEPIYSRCECR